MLSQFKIGARLGGAFAVILLLLLAASGTGLFSVTRIADTTREALETDGALASNAGVVRRLALELRRYEKDVFINLADFQALNGYFGKWSDTVTQLKSVLDEGEALAVVITRSITLPLADALGVARRIAQGDLRERIVARGRDEPAQLLAAMAEMSDSLVKLVSALRGASETVYIGANEIALGAQDLSSRTEEQAAALQETAASMEEISATSEHNEKNTREADRLADAASRSAQHGGEEMRANIDLMEKVVASSKKMNGIIATIDDIAFQTNILALNASVEAARAGEKGRGFAVVASEVRLLASRAGDSAGEIRALLESTGAQIATCADQTQRSGETLNGTVESIKKLAELMRGVASATTEQIGGIQQISTAVTQMDAVTQQSAALVQQSSSAAGSLEDQASHLKSLVTSFRIPEA
ncbi:MAG TPA: hypothetical protein DCM00_02805 [Alcanivorax sp.]|uniref:Methyl accepting chemotaxis sensory transducer n=1 Tax=Alloalcanivorax venustensis ISO4 TaxID=1177184 RepID=A0ABS0AG20_9GAMM|nr:methyl-accepting chemotaxis protein [Alloalcanivorax venustensis]MBF5053088.1 methyl accepting chemotaxis sensory transducer [Alloalcanivorax venustensis ISO4]HAJ41587.1 hypothetical protein [Alcanivorax sp.]